MSTGPVLSASTLRNLKAQGFLNGIALLTSATQGDATGASSLSWGTGAPNHTAASGAVYIRTDAADSDTVFYRNTDGATAWEAVVGSEVADLLAATNAWTGTNTFAKVLAAASSELTIAAGAVAAVRWLHSVDTEADAASDDLDDITGGAAGQLLMVRAESDARTVVLRHAIGANKIATPGGRNISLAEATDFALLESNGTQWIVVASSTLIDSVTQIKTGSIGIGLGNTQQGTADLGLGSLSGKIVVCSLGQAAEDATAKHFWGVGEANGTVTVKCDVATTAGTTVYYMVDAR